GLHSKMTLVSAPPGFGKTTLLAEWVELVPDVEHAVAWLSLDGSDNQPQSFWTNLVASLRFIEPEARRAVLAQLQSSQPLPVETLLRGLLNGLAEVQHDFVVVLDDYHVIETSVIHEG